MHRGQEPKLPTVASEVTMAIKGTPSKELEAKTLRSIKNVFSRSGQITIISRWL